MLKIWLQVSRLEVRGSSNRTQEMMKKLRMVVVDQEQLKIPLLRKPKSNEVREPSRS
jgi:hypothetical protein